MPSIVLAVLAAAVLAYVVVVGAAAAGGIRVRRRPVPPSPAEWPTVSVVVPARNEAGAVGACLDSLLACTYPAEKLEVVVVDDGSTDATRERVRAASPVAAGAAGADQPAVRLIEAPPAPSDASSDASSSGPSGEDAPAPSKARALGRGIEASSGTVILTTDADCTVPPGWIRAMVRRCTPETPFVAGPVRVRHDERWFNRLQALEVAGLVAFGAGSLGLGQATFCNSANVAYRRNVLDAIDRPPNGPAHDEMLLQHVAYGTDRAVTFAADADAVVTTQPVADFDAYLRQRSRWASMGLRYPFWPARLQVLVLWVAHTVLFALLAAALALPAWRQPALAGLLVKMGTDAVLVPPMARLMDQGGLLRSFVPAQLLLLVSTPLAGLIGSFGSLEWKGRPVE